MNRDRAHPHRGFGPGEEPGREGEPLGDDPGAVDPAARAPIDQEVPIPGTPRARVSLVWGLLILLIVVATLVWFIASNASRMRPGGVIG